MAGLGAVGKCARILTVPPDQWYLRVNSDLCADSILNGIVEHARFLDIKGPNMREYTARLKRAGDESYWE